MWICWLSPGLEFYLSYCLLSYRPIYWSIYRFIDRFIDLFVALSIDLSVDLSTYLSIFRSIFRSICRSVYRSVYRSILHTIYRSIDPSIGLSIVLSIYLFYSIYLSIYRSFDKLHNGRNKQRDLTEPEVQTHKFKPKRSWKGAGSSEKQREATRNNVQSISSDLALLSNDSQRLTTQQAGRSGTRGAI